MIPGLNEIFLFLGEKSGRKSSMWRVLKTEHCIIKGEAEYSESLKKRDIQDGKNETESLISSSSTYNNDLHYLI